MDFISQTDVTSYGVFLCFFFECVAIGVNLEQFYVKQESEEVPEEKYEKKREQFGLGRISCMDSILYLHGKKYGPSHVQCWGAIS